MASCQNTRILRHNSYWNRPWTHHVRWIEPDATVADRLFVGIELGGVMRSLDRGQTWEDRKSGSQHDCHTLRTHKLAPSVLYEAAGGGFAESRDGGATWRGHDEGRRHPYLWGLAVDPADPDTLVVSGSPGPRSAHNDEYAEALLYRRTKAAPGNQSVQVYLIQRVRGPIYWRPTRRDLYRSTDAGQSWEKLSVAWSAQARFNTVNAMVVTETT